MLLFFLLLMANFEMHQFLIERRSIRRFEHRPIPPDKLHRIVETALYAPSAGNTQPWYIIVVQDTGSCRLIYENTLWLAGKPPYNEAPSAYLLVLWEKARCPDWPGIASCAALCTYILLAAHAESLGAVWIGSITNKDLLIHHFGIPKELDLFSIIALGYPNESPKPVPAGEDYHPYRRDGQLFVPKYSVTDKVKFDRWQ